MDFVSKRWWYFGFSALVILAGIVSMLIPPAFRVGIEFTGGSALSITFDQPVSQSSLRDVLTALGHPEAVIQRTGERSFLVRTAFLKEGRPAQGDQPAVPSESETIRQALAERLAPITAMEIASVSPIVAGETVQRAIIAVAVAAVVILFYIWFAFRRVQKAWRMGVAAVIALIHDVLVTLGLFSLLGKFFNVEVNAMFITAALTVVGYSVHDTIVVFDRIRENASKGVARDLEGVVNFSIAETLGRSLNTSLTTLLALLALLLLGGPTIRSFLLAMAIGIITGTYSSIFTAAQILVAWERGEWRGPFRARRGVAVAAKPSGA
ncbi:MAG: protein translocase subunit SecF [Dehalococcoidia bacterium]|nr:protein translocase subunit SecF [Dehalococcoidia bacterium]MDW8119194.1 protein translocase subunit SecF [Chloroflexota bacterium]